jgi:hypothetical protein
MNPSYAGFLQVTDEGALNILDELGLFACFRAVEVFRLPKIHAVPPSLLYTGLRANLMLVGWDVCSGNGWLSASSHGIFPINPFTGEVIDVDAKINCFGLFDDADDAERCCAANNLGLSSHAPWYPVGVLLTAKSYERLRRSLDPA